MTIPFTLINTAALNAGVFVESVRGPKTGSFRQVRRMLIIGTATAASTGPKLAVTRVWDAEDGHKNWGYGTPIGTMVQEVMAVSSGIELYVLASSDTSGTAATKTVTLTSGPASAAGVIKGKIGGVEVRANFAKSDTITTIAAAWVAAVQAATKLPMSAANSAGVITLTAKWKGETGGDIQVTDVTVADTSGASVGVSVAVAAGVTGAGDPDQTSAMGVLLSTDMTFTEVVTEYTNATALGLITDEMTRRALPTVARRGRVFVAKYGSQGTVTTWEGSRSIDELCPIAPGTGPALPWLVAAHVAATRSSAVSELVTSLGRTLPNRIPKPARSEAISAIAREALAALGVSSLVLNEYGDVQIEILRMSSGLGLYTHEILGAIEFDLRASLYEQVIAAGLRIVSDSKDPQSGGEISPSGIRSIMETRLRGALRDFFTDPDAVVASLLVEPDANNGSAVNVMFSDELVKHITSLNIKQVYT